MQFPHAGSLPSDSASVDRAAALRQLTRQVIVRGGLFAVAAAALLGGGMLLAARELVLTLKAARQDAPGARLDLGLVLEQRPDVVALCAGLALASLLAAWAGSQLLRATLGPERRFPQRWALAAFFPIFLVSVLGAVQWASVLGGGALCIGLLGMTVAGLAVTPQLTVTSAVSLWFLARVAQRRFVPVAAEEVPAEHGAALSRYDKALREQGFEPAGVFASAPRADHFFASWRFPDFPAHLHVARFVQPERTVDYVSATTVTSDGHHFETTNANPEAVGSSQDASPFYHHLVADDPIEVAEFHRAKVQQWLASAATTAREIRPDEIPAESAFGLAHLTRLLRERGRQPAWQLGDQFAGFPLPPLPGRPWLRATR